MVIRSKKGFQNVVLPACYPKCYMNCDDPRNYLGRNPTSQMIQTCRTNCTNCKTQLLQELQPFATCIPGSSNCGRNECKYDSKMRGNVCK